VCDSLELTPVLDHDGVLNAQNTIEKCQLLASAFNVNGGFRAIGNFIHSCAGITSTGLICSTSPNCPELHLANADDNVVSLCPCE